MINSIYIINSNGLPIFQCAIEDEKCELKRHLDGFDEIRFAGVSAAIQILLSEMGHKDLHSINTSDGVLVYSSEANQLIFVAGIKDKKYERFATFFVKQIELEFLQSYAKIVDMEKLDYVDTQLFEPFYKTVEELYLKLKKLYLREPVFFDIFEPDIPLKLFLSSIEYESSLLESYPDSTIKLVRALYRQYTGDVGAKILTAIGHFFGYRLNEKANKDKIVSSIDDLLKLLNEISVAGFNKGNNEIVLEICPICRGFTSEEPMCYFFTGFIKGVLNNPLLTITETKCRAKGDKYCTFQIMQQD